jgi:hypothetical protein
MIYFLLLLFSVADPVWSKEIPSKMTPIVHILKLVFIGVDARYSLPSSETTYNYGPLMGIQLGSKFPARIWTGPSISEVNFTEPNGFRIGVGVRLKTVNLNLEFLKNRFDPTLKGAEPRDQMDQVLMFFSLSFLL